jgi:hypothetical protein
MGFRGRAIALQAGNPYMTRETKKIPEGNFMGVTGFEPVTSCL